jgi:hypothetical protein
MIYISLQNCNAVSFSSTDKTGSTSVGESLIAGILKQKFPAAKYIEVQDISGITKTSIIGLFQIFF